MKAAFKQVLSLPIDLPNARSHNIKFKISAHTTLVHTQEKMIKKQLAGGGVGSKGHAERTCSTCTTRRRVWGYETRIEKAAADKRNKTMVHMTDGLQEKMSTFAFAFATGNDRWV